MARGDRSAALRQYESCRAALRDDLDVEPLPETTRLYQWIVGQPQHRAPHEARAGNLPVPATTFIGRRRELEECVGMLRRPDARLITLTGAGGSGKTRLGLEAAAAVVAEYSHGAFFVDLSALRQPDLLPSAIARTVGAQAADKQSLAAALLDFLREKQMLLVLDNFEQIIDAAPLLSDLLQSCPRLKLLVTSRAALRLTSEYEYPLLPLAVPDPRRLPELPALSQFEAVALFIDRARAARPDFAVTNDNAPAVAEICARLDGLPLAIELAATRTRLLPPQAMLAQLERRLEFLVAGPRDLPERHQTLRAAIAWSYDLLSPDEQRLFRRLAVFAGGWTLETAEAVCGGDVLNRLGGLVEGSLVRRQDTGGGVRFSLLETVREYALERLAESGEAMVIRRAHAQAFLALAQEAEPKLRGPEQRLWLDAMEAEMDNLRAALQWSIDNNDAEIGLLLSNALFELWQRRGHSAEAVHWYSTILGLPAAQTPSPLRTRVLTLTAWVAGLSGDNEQEDRLSSTALSLGRSQDDKLLLAWCLYVRSGSEPWPAAQTLLNESLELYRETGDQRGMALALNGLANIEALQTVDVPAALALRQQALELGRAIGDKRLLTVILIALGREYDNSGHRDAAREYIQSSRKLAEEIGDRARTAAAIGWLGITAPDFTEGARLAGEAAAICRDIGRRNDFAWWLANQGYAYCWTGNADEAELCIKESLVLSDEIGNRFMQTVGYGELGMLANVRGDRQGALRAERRALRLGAQGAGTAWCYYNSLAEISLAAIALGQWQRAARWLGALCAFENRTGFGKNPMSRAPKILAALQEHMDDPAVAAARADGQAMTIEQAGLAALKELDEELGPD
jgi:predicted ATPase